MKYWVDVYYWHEHSQFKGPSVSDPQEWQILPLVHVQMLTMYTESVACSFLIWDDCSPRLLRCRQSTQCPRLCFACVVCVCLSFLISPLPSQTYKPSHSATASELWDWWNAMEESTWKNCLKTVHFIAYNWSCIDGSVSHNPWKCYMDSMRECRAITSKKGKKNIWKECHVLSGVCLTAMATLACCASALNNDGTASFAWIISIFPPK